MTREELSCRQRALRDYIVANRLPEVLHGLTSALLTRDARQVELHVTDDLQPATDGVSIWVSMPPGLLGPAWESWWGVLFRPIVAHECQHLNSSDFGDLEHTCAWLAGELERQGLPPAVGRQVGGRIHNILEDARIEQISVSRHPGLRIPYQYLNDALRQGCAILRRAQEPPQEYRDFTACLLSYAKTGRCAPGARHYAGTALEKAFFAALPWVDAAAGAVTSADCRRAAQGLLRDILPYLTALLKLSPALQRQLEEAAPAEEYRGCCQEREYNDSPGEAARRLRHPAAAPGAAFPSEAPASPDRPPLSPRRGQGDAPGDHPGGFSRPPREGRDYSPEDLQALERSFRRSVEALDRREVPREGLDADLSRQLTAAYGPEGPLHVCLERESTGSLPVPQDIRLEARQLHRELAGLLRNRSACLRDQHSGALDPRALWRWGFQDRDLFCRPGRRDTGSCVFYLLIDCSGSMGADAGDPPGCSRSQAALRSAAVIEEALRGLVPLKIALFQKVSHCRHRVLKDFPDRPANACWNALYTVTPLGSNADSVHIRLAAAELKRRPERRRVLVVLSDGMPSAYLSRGDGEAEVRRAVEEARRMGITTVPILFGDRETRAACLGTCRRMYGGPVLSADPACIRRALPALFRTLVFSRG